MGLNVGESAGKAWGLVLRACFARCYGGTLSIELTRHRSVAFSWERRNVMQSRQGATGVPLRGPVAADRPSLWL
jgi:hypothetical protein